MRFLCAALQQTRMWGSIGQLSQRVVLFLSSTTLTHTDTHTHTNYGNKSNALCWLCVVCVAPTVIKVNCILLHVCVCLWCNRSAAFDFRSALFHKWLKAKGYRWISLCLCYNTKRPMVRECSRSDTVIGWGQWNWKMHAYHRKRVVRKKVNEHSDCMCRVQLYLFRTSKRNIAFQERYSKGQCESAAT
jgi:hypothetical protein